MSTLTRVSTAALAVSLAAAMTSAAGLERVDDRTAFDPVSGARVPLPPSPERAFVATPAGALRGAGDAWVGCSWSDDAYPFAIPSHTPGAVVDLLPDANYPYDATMTDDGADVWFPGASGDGVVVVDRTTGAVVQRIPVGTYPIGVVFTADGRLALVSSRDDYLISRIDTTTYSVVDTVAMPGSPGNMARDPITGNIYAVEWYGPALYELSPDGSTLLRMVTLGDSLWQLVVAPDGRHVYVTERDPNLNLVRVVDRASMTEVRTIAVGDDPWGIDVTADGLHLVVACEDDGLAQVIDTQTWMVRTVPLATDADPRDVDILDLDGVAYVVGGRVGTPTRSPVYVLDIAGAAVITSFDLPGDNTNVIAVAPALPPSSCGLPPRVGGLTAVRQGDDVHLAWEEWATASEGYNVWRVATKEMVPEAHQPERVGVHGVCLPAPVDPSPGCVDPGAVAATVLDFYQVLNLCGGIEGP